ncbi:MAG: cell division protein SepF [Solirubrobacterales bacterium]
MALGDTWRRALEYFGLVDGDYIEEGEYTDEHDVDGPDTMGGNVAQPREPARAVSTGRERGRGAPGAEDIDDIFGEDEPPPRRRAGRSAPSTSDDLAPMDAGGNGADVQMKLVNPRSFNDAQQVADEFKSSRPVILNLQDTNADLARRLIDFCSGLTYALGGGMQKIANQTFLLTPANVQVSAAEAERMLERGFFNQS